MPLSGMKPRGLWYRIIDENFAVDREVPCLTRLKILLAFSQFPVIGMVDNLNPVHAFKYEGHLESKERFAIKKYLLIIGKKKNMQVLSHTFTYFST